MNSAKSVEWKFTGISICLIEIKLIDTGSQWILLGQITGNISFIFTKILIKLNLKKTQLLENIMIENKKVSCIILSGGRGPVWDMTVLNSSGKIYGVPVICHTVENLAPNLLLMKYGVVSEADLLRNARVNRE